MKTIQQVILLKDDTQKVYENLFEVANVLKISNPVDPVRLLPIRGEVFQVEGTEFYVLLGHFPELAGSPQAEFSEREVPEPMLTYLNTLSPGTEYHYGEVRAAIEAAGVIFRSTHEYTKLLHIYAKHQGYVLKTNTRDGRFQRNSKRYLCFLKAM